MNLTNKQTHYFASDGNYGAAEQVIILRTDHWDADDWTAIEESWDGDRVSTALEIVRKYGG